MFIDAVASSSHDIPDCCGMDTKEFEEISRRETYEYDQRKR